MNNWLETDLLAARAATSPEDIAVIDAGDGPATGAATDHLSYADLDSLVDDLARRLTTLGIEPGEHVATLLDTGLPFVAVVHALDRLSAVLVPLNSRLTPEESAAQCERVGVETLLSTAAQAEQAEAVAAALRDRSNTEHRVALVDGETDSGTAVWDREPAGSLPVIERSPADRRLVLFTSGTTGTPKAVPLTTRNLVASAVASAFRLGVTPDERWLCALPMYHMGGLAPVFRSTLYGTTVVLQSSFDAERTPAAARAHDVTGLSLVPTMLHRILDADETLPDSLRFVLLGGGPADASLIERAEEDGIPVCPTYGMTETASQIATARPAEAVEHEGTVGRPLFGTEVTIVDEEATPVETGETGELVVAGPTVTPGYTGARATAEAFGPYGLHTGDLGHRDEGGRLWITGRRVDRIVTGGENVDPDEVRTTLRDHPAVEDAAVVGLEDEEWGQRVAALVVPSEGARPDADALREHCRERLAGYKLPRSIAVAESLPRTASGTVDRATVRERLLDPE
ncbi:o-succinylbenzoate--CoA ligase [Natronoarchaeum sp. GCM10025321]|uniref:o-succinylbenzoate--CoA ligase n=1 Tax=Natronoarchaeum sp. GCM10025321 TaxID=3252684 RepID=UPI00361136C1